MNDRQLQALLEALDYERREKRIWRQYAVFWWAIAVIANAAMWIEIARCK